ncbi:TRAP transporter large permease subunit [Chloroflexota bacterium]
MTGYPLPIIMGGLGLGVGYATMGPAVGKLLYPRIFYTLTNYILLAVPLFVFMGNMLEGSGITERLYDALYLWLGKLRGGLAIATVLIGTVMAACVGIIAASVTMLALIALPSMVKRGYSKSLAAGSVCAGGTLGILIPPSVMIVIYGPTAGLSVGKLFMGAFVPGFVLSGLYCSYIAIRCFLQPKIAPPVPADELKVPFMKKTVTLAAALLPTALLILAVLGSIFTGIAAPTEAAAVGALAATILALAYHRLNWQVLKETGTSTVKLAGMIFLFVALAIAFTGVFISTGAGKVVEELILAMPGGKWGAFAMIMFICFILGFFIDWVGIILIMVPIITPIGNILGFDPIWFAMMVIVNLQMSFMTPPFAGAIFITRGVAPPELNVTMGDIIRGVFPFVFLIIIGLGLCIIFPQLILWLPSMMIR